MINTNKTKSIIIKLFLIFFFNSLAIASINSFIVLKVDNEIITNLDIKQEYNYLIALNNELKNLDKKSIIDLAKNSLIREKIKKNELSKYYEFDHTKKYLNKIMRQFYLKLNFNDMNEFENYLKDFDLTLNKVKSKIEIEVLWNELIMLKYDKHIDINKDKLKKKILNQRSLNNIKTKYELSEIVFQVDKKKNLKNKIKEIKESIISKGFKNTANIYSISDTAKFGGNIGWVNEGQLSKLILEKVKKLNIGEITDPVNIPGGFLIIKLKNIKTEKVEINLEEELKNLTRFEKDRQLNQFSAIYFNKLKLNSKISEQ
jgi:peptidyl-prolyl cis-trans isomerase SurA